MPLVVWGGGLEDLVKYRRGHGRVRHLHPRELYVNSSERYAYAMSRVYVYFADNEEKEFLLYLVAMPYALFILYPRPIHTELRYRKAGSDWYLLGMEATTMASIMLKNISIWSSLQTWFTLWDNEYLDAGASVTIMWSHYLVLFRLLPLLLL